MTLNDIILKAITDSYPTGIAFAAIIDNDVYIDWVDDTTTIITATTSTETPMSEARVTTGPWTP